MAKYVHIDSTGKTMIDDEEEAPFFQLDDNNDRENIKSEISPEIEPHHEYISPRKRKISDLFPEEESEFLSDDEDADEDENNDSCAVSNEARIVALLNMTNFLTCLNISLSVVTLGLLIGYIA
jgi:hypothetical protein